VDVADFGLSNQRVEGAQILTLYATSRTSAKVIVLLPHQTLPEHWHPPVGDDPGKEETVRTFWGTLLVYLAGEPSLERGRIVPGKEGVYTLRRELALEPGDQLSLDPGEKHWFQAGADGAVFFSFSSVVRDVLDGFTDPAIVRTTQITED